MTANYWVARYIGDVFRNEPKNVGVICQTASGSAAKFVGEREDGVLDGRKLVGFTDPEVYSQWITYWRKTIALARIDEIVMAKTPNFFVVEGGSVADTDEDSASEVCNFLYHALVGEGGIKEAYQWTDTENAEQSLSKEIAAALTQAAVIDGANVDIYHPVLKEQEVQGRSVAHKPSFSQRNGHLYVMEYLDLGLARQKNVRERAGWMAYMFTDITSAEPSATTYSLVRSAANDGEVVEFAQTVLRGSSEIINWNNPAQRIRFIEERQRVASAING